MKGEWCYHYKAFSRDECELILRLGLLIPDSEAVVGYGRTAPEYRRSRIRFIQKSNPVFSWLFDKLWNITLDANDKWFQVHLSKLDYIQLAEYDAEYEGKYDKHHDVFWLSDKEYHRKISVVIQLSDPTTYEGGDLELLDADEKPNKEHIREQGTAIFFPSMMYHKANQVTKGKRYSLACWFDGPHWK